MDKILKASIKINNVPEDATESGFMVVTLDHGTLWYYGLYYDEKRAEMAAAEFDNKFIIKI